MATLCVLLVVACYFDYKKGKIPNLLLLIMLGVGLVNAVADGGVQKAFSFLFGSFLVMLFLYPLFKIGGLGAGDVKLYGVCVGYLPEDKFLFFLFFSLFFAAIFSLVKMIKECNAIERISYLCEYVAEVVRSGHFRLYIENEKERKSAGICLAGPILCSALMHMGGVY